MVIDQTVIYNVIGSYMSRGKNLDFFFSFGCYMIILVLYNYFATR